MQFLLLSIFLSLPASGPDYTTNFGLVVYDPGHLSSPEQIDSWIIFTMVAAPEDEWNAMLEALKTATLVIHPSENINGISFCGQPPPGKTLVGCTDFAGTMTIAWRKCNVKLASPGVFGHEIGHLVGHWGHDYAPWFEGEKVETKVNSLACGMCQ